MSVFRTHPTMAFQLLKSPQLIPTHARRLIYASIILTFPTLAFSMAARYGFLSLYMIPGTVLLTWVYHIVLIVLHNQSVTSPSTHEQHHWQTVHALIWGYILAILWTASTCLAGVMAGLWESWEFSDEVDIPWIRTCATLDVVFALGSTAVMWALVAVSTHLRRTNRRTLSKRDGLRELMFADA